MRYFGSEADEATLRKLVREQLYKFSDNNQDLSPDEQEILKSSYQNIADATYLKNKKKGRVISFNNHTFIRIAACASIIILAGAFYFRKQYLINFTAGNSYQQTITLKGQRKQLILTDGTKIWLAPGSALGYTDNFSGKTRDVNLRGEAFFEVAHDARHPFIIHTGKLNTVVLGTTFNVQAYPERTAVEVVLLSGKVGVVEPGKQSLILAPQQKATFNKANESLNKENYPAAADMLARRNGKLIYRGALLSDVVNDISQAYNVTIMLGREVQNLRYYGEFDQKEKLRSVLMEISLSANLRIENKGVTWKLHK